MRQTEKEYAEALFLLAVEHNTIDSFTTALSVVERTVTAAYLEFLRSPAIPLSERLSAVDEAFGTLPADVVSFIKLLCENGRILVLPACIAEFAALVQAHRHCVAATVTSATPLSDAQKAALCQKLGTMIGKTIVATYLIDETLIGGLTIEVEGKTYDGSLKHRLQDIKDVMLG